ncbi:MAG: hypothetical protein AAB316_17925, partial [Bacteroidota bacterium]
NQSYERKNEQHLAAQSLVNPPLENIQPDYAKFAVNVHQGGVYEYPSGSKVVVPAAAFTNEQGKLLEGEVTLHYREMHDFVDFFLAGVPMTYDSAGVTYTLESAGMVEIFAEQNGKRVNLAPGKSLDVELRSRVNVSPSIAVPVGYNIYKLDEQKRNWVYQEIDRMEVLDEPLAEEVLDENDPLYPAKKERMEKLKAISVSEQAEMAKVEASLPKLKEPVKPQQANKSDAVFDLKFDALTFSNGNENEQAELKELYSQYEKMLWQLSPQSSITPEQLQAGFSNVSGIAIKKMNSRDYELTLRKANQSLTIIANPVLSGNDYEKAMAEFNRDFEKWQQATTEREAKLKAKKDAIRQQFQEEKRLAQLAYDKKLEDLRRMGLYAEATDEIIKKKVINRFKATGFGIWNCDRPLPPDEVQLAANFQTEQGESLEFLTGFLVDKSKNTVTRFLATDGARLRFNRNSANLLWVVTADNKFAVFRPEDFKQIEKGEDSYTFVLEKVDKEIRDEEDVREILFL